MKRRDFLAAASTLAANSLLLPIEVDGFSLKALGKNSALVKALKHTTAAFNDRILVIVYLNGGNDGLNTVIPRDQYGTYQALRSNIAIPEEEILPLAGNDVTGFHPAMSGLRNLYNEGKLSIIHSVSYPNPSQSHFRSTDILMTAVDADQTETTGWAGRYLEDRFQGYPADFPNEVMEDPLAIQIGYLTSPTLLGTQQSMGIAISDPNSFYQLVSPEFSASTNELPCCDAGDLIAHIRKQQILSIGYAGEIKQAADLGTNMAAYPPGTDNNSLAEQLKIVARLIHGGLKTKIYFVSLSGFDTHAGQVTNSNSTEGEHAVLLGKLSAAISSFQQDIQLQGIEDKVVGMTFSDFGRRATSNASKGTDHGVAAPMFVFGSSIKKQVVGHNPDLTNGLLPVAPLPWENYRDIAMQIDFRRVYADILNDWFGTETTKTDTFLFNNFNTLTLFSDHIETIASGYWTDPTIWTAGRPPLSTEYVRINPGHTVQVLQSVTVRNVHMQGNLQFAGNAGIHLTG
ncbi:DUF1501 domain-containing protein [Arundinibacter roseus]|uniref:DUF1501 domain-containing protein n=1 Tax=Arundinibacter roseus TaxID=2070510 RepID=A0A4R4KNS6_9BACT|nr:DUF1501 domain-containing protein [Arundinibacter roseus]TDB68231.1 DUF1501 domain-containing protein [Arundinibacter roseus]